MAQAPEPKLLTLMGFNATGDLGALTMYTSQRGHMVAFPKTNPLNPPSYMQHKMRNFFRICATQWRALSPEAREAWSRAALHAGLRVTGYNLFLWYQRTLDRPTIETIERQSGESLI